jgi:hypothetical protein
MKTEYGIPVPQKGDGRVPSAPGSREPDPQAVPALTGFDPSRIKALAARAQPLLDCDHRGNRPNPRVLGERIVGFVISEDDIGLGLSEPLMALDALVHLARLAIAMEAHQGRDATRLDGEAATARAEGIAQTEPASPNPPVTEKG